MNTYAVQCFKKEDGTWSLESREFDTAVDGASDLQAGILALKALMADAGNRMLSEGKMLPEVKPVTETGDACVFVEFDLEARFQAANQAPVRRNVSMPAWLDLRLRKNNVDASRLFQEAAMERLAKIAREGLD